MSPDTATPNPAEPTPPIAALRDMLHALRSDPRWLDALPPNAAGDADSPADDDHAALRAQIDALAAAFDRLDAPAPGTASPQDSAAPADPDAALAALCAGWEHALEEARDEADQWLSEAQSAVGNYQLFGTFVIDARDGDPLWSVRGGDQDPEWSRDALLFSTLISHTQATRQIALLERQVNDTLRNIDHLARTLAAQLHAELERLDRARPTTAADCLPPLAPRATPWTLPLPSVALDFIPSRHDGFLGARYTLSEDAREGWERSLVDVADTALESAVNTQRQAFEEHILDVLARDIERYRADAAQCLERQRSAQAPQPAAEAAG
ncbi:MAG: hypothetical protein P8011_15885 [Acidihalobacter sp.]|uniref:hypothetical protein n=1 Tax=Acidihalobacter sp. TaxID=1872108 RepID=UPI00307E5757